MISTLIEVKSIDLSLEEITFVLNGSDYQKWAQWWSPTHPTHGSMWEILGVSGLIDHLFHDQ